MDEALCPSVIDTLREDDYEYVVQSYCGILLNNPEYLLKRLEGIDIGTINVLAIIEEPGTEELRIELPHFDFVGFDLIDDRWGVSVICNCRWEDVYSELSPVALIAQRDTAYWAKELWRSQRRDPDHRSAKVWAIWRRVAVERGSGSSVKSAER